MAKKKRKRPIYKFELEEYIGEIEIPSESDILDYKSFEGNCMLEKDGFRIVFDTCMFNKVTITQNVFKRSEFIDCTFIDCDLSNNEFQSSTFMRCEFVNTRLTGSHFVESFLSHILIDKCHCNYIDFADSKLEFCEFTDSMFKEANFYDNKMKNTMFDKLILDKSTFYQSSLKDIDLSTSDIYEIRTDLKSIKGVKIASFQAREVCNLLGIKVID